MEVYKKIAGVRSREEYYEMQEELEDRYGDLPRCVQALLEVVLVKAEAHALGITAVSQKRGNILLEFRAQPNIDPARLTALITGEKGRYLFTAGAAPYLTMKLKKEEEGKPLEPVKALLKGLSS